MGILLNDYNLYFLNTNFNSNDAKSDGVYKL